MSQPTIPADKSGSKDGSLAIITGAGCGIGYAIAEELAREGEHVILNDIDEELCNKAAQSIVSQGFKCTPMPGDCSKVSFLQAMIDTTAEIGPITKCIANAGITTYGHFLECREDQFDRLIDVNLKGAFFLIQLAAKKMIAQKVNGRILIMSSVTGVQAHPFLAAYGMTKGGLQMLSRALVPELTPHNILVNTIAPGAVQTERTLKEDPQYAEKWGSIYPTGRACLPKDIAKAAVFLLSHENQMINGQTIVVDAGWTTLGPMPENLDFPV